MSATLEPHVETMVMMIAADGEYHDNERAFLLQELKDHPEAVGLTPDQIDDLIGNCAGRVLHEGVDARLAQIAKDVVDRPQRLDLLRSALIICVADGEVADEEMELLRKIAAAFDLSDDDIKSQVDAMLGGQ